MGGYCSIGSVKGQLHPVPTLKGKLSIPLYTLCEHEEYDGEYTVVPGEEQIVLATAGKLLTHDIVVEPSQGIIPSDSMMATDEDIDDLINDVFGDETTGDDSTTDEPTYDEDDIATEEELEDVITDVFG